MTVSLLHHKALRLVCFMIVAVALSSCDDDDPYGYGSGVPAQFVGSWELTAINGAPVGFYDYTTYDFYSGGSGFLGIYYGNQWVSQPLSWSVSVDNGGYGWLYVSTSSNYFTYSVDYISGNTMVITDNLTGNQLEYQRM